MGLTAQQGVSLVELLLALAVLSLLMVTVRPLQLAMIDNAGLRKAQQEIIAGLRFSRSRAVNSQAVVTLAINTADGRMTIGNERRDLRIPDDVTLSMDVAPSEQLSKDERAVRFFPDGSSTGLELLFRQGDRVSRIDVDWLTGRVSSAEE